MADAVILRLPKPTINVIGWEADAAVSGSVSFTLPVLSFATGNIEGTRLTLPKPALAVTGYAGIVTTAFQNTLTLPVPVLSASGTPGVTGSVVFALPKPQLSVGSANRADLRLPAPALASTGAAGVIGSATLSRPSLQLVVTGAVPFVGQVALSLLPSLAVVGSAGVKGSVDLTLRRLALAASGYTGAVGGATLALPVFKISATGQKKLVGTVELTIPMLRLEVTGRTATVGTSAAYALNVENLALTTYTNYGFNSLTRFNGVYLGATDAGIFALTGADDAGTAIDAVARVGVSDFGTALIKRIARAYVGYKADGELELRVTTEEAQTRRYRLASSGKTGLHGGRVKIGMGVEARYWQFEIANVAGADFTLNCIEVTPTRMGRRVRGSET